MANDKIEKKMERERCETKGDKTKEYKLSH
jgi:hypothetical protein